jgi:HPt (histidine-containing phosphotransfer) domain-containing protein
MDAARITDTAAFTQLVSDLGREGVVELIDEMAAATAASLDALRDAQSRGDLPGLARAAQALKVNCDMVGASVLAQDCAALAAMDKPDLAEPLLATVTAGYTSLIEQLRQWRG